jgi:hypothetical protein
VTFDVDPSAHTLAGDGGPRAIPARRATPGTIVEVAADGFAGAVVRCSDREVVLRDRRGRERTFGNSPGAFLVDDVRVRLVPDPAAGAATAAHPGRSSAELPVTASGSIAIETRARVARAGRILVEGIHDAELVEHVWGADLRVEGVVVEPLHGADDLADVVRRFSPGPGRRLGILLDHLVDGTKESRIAAGVAHPHVLITGHPFVDIWAAVSPERLGLAAWPDVPRGQPWKEGIARALGTDDVMEAWRRIRSSVRSWRDLDRSLIRAVEELIDFVTDPPADAEGGP